MAGKYTLIGQTLSRFRFGGVTSVVIMWAATTKPKTERIRWGASQRQK